jgi:hypothetical protein
LAPCRRLAGVPQLTERLHVGELSMSSIEEIKSAIESLSLPEFVLLRKWILEKHWEIWDSQIEADSEFGKLDFVVDEALKEKASGTLQNL